MEKYIKRNGAFSIIISLVLVVLAIFLINKPEQSINFILMSIGGVLAVSGIIHVVAYFSASKEVKSFSFELLQGIISIIVGAVLVFNPGIVTNIIQYIIGCWIIVQSILRIQMSLNMKASGYSEWKFAMIFAVINLVLGLIIVFYPYTVELTVILCGAMLLVSELINIGQTVYVMIKAK